MELSNKQIQDIAQSVEGTSNDHLAVDALKAAGLDIWDLEEVCEKVEQFKCDNCAWWGHQGEPLNLNGMCDDCYEDCDKCENCGLPSEEVSIEGTCEDCEEENEE